MIRRTDTYCKIWSNQHTRSISSGLNRSVPYLLSPNIHTFQIWGANTDVGKTIMSTILCRTAVQSLKKPKVHYLKPVQTGGLYDSDTQHVMTFGSSIYSADVLHIFKHPVSPHRAAKMENRDLSDKQVLIDVERKLAEYTDASTIQNPSWAFVETAGGVLSPTCSGSLQADAYRPLRIPAVLVGDAKLGGIATTLSSMEALRLRGFDIAMILILIGPEENHTIIPDHIPKSTRLVALPAPPVKNIDIIDDAVSLEQYYAYVTASKEAQNALAFLEETDAARIAQINDLDHRARNIVWYPFTQHATLGQVTVIDSACGDDYLVATPTKEFGKNKSVTRLFDGPASWWTQTLGHGNTELAMAAGSAAGRYGHVIFPQCAHKPAMDLAHNLLTKVVPKQMQHGGRVFFSDNGSTATEVAMKMALHWTSGQYKSSRPLNIIGVQGSYHGDTMGAMDMCPPSVFNKHVSWYMPKGCWIDPPTLQWTKGSLVVRIPPSMIGTDKEQVHVLVSYTESFRVASLFDKSRLDTDPLAEIYTKAIQSFLNKSGKEEIGALILEPVIQGAGGMLWVDPLFTRILVQQVRQGTWNPNANETWTGRVPVIYDEVFTGCWRLGPASVSQWLEVPDIVCYAKSLTGGVVPMAVTCTTSEIFDAYLAKDLTSALLHGHSYTANPVACSVANATIDQVTALPFYNRVARKFPNIWEDDVSASQAVQWLSHLPYVRGVVAIGTLVAIEIHPLDNNAGYATTSSLIGGLVDQCRANGIFLRPLGNVVYIIGSHSTPSSDFVSVIRVLGQLIEDTAKNGVLNNPVVSFVV